MFYLFQNCFIVFYPLFYPVYAAGVACLTVAAIPTTLIPREVSHIQSFASKIEICIKKACGKLSNLLENETKAIIYQLPALPLAPNAFRLHPFFKKIISIHLIFTNTSARAPGSPTAHSRVCRAHSLTSARRWSVSAELVLRHQTASSANFNSSQ